MKERITAVVVTYNRKELLARCLARLRAQRTPAYEIVVVNNASSDGTNAMLDDANAAFGSELHVCTLSENLGGAGGFAKGMRIAVDRGADWVWMMDDDAEPHLDALQELMAVANDLANIYGSLAVCGGNTSWATTLIDEHRTTHLADEVPDHARVESIPLLGFLIHRSFAEKIGYPDAGFFIAADDVEYCLRARRAGADIVIAGKSRIEHPRTQQKIISLLGAKITYLSLAPWKRYYDTRNRLLIARKYYGWRLFTQTIPGAFARLLAAMLHEPHKLTQFWAWSCGMFDGLFGIKGKRHQKWGIRL